MRNEPIKNLFELKNYKDPKIQAKFLTYFILGVIICRFQYNKNKLENASILSYSYKNMS